jgi:hypothetical protein
LARGEGSGGASWRRLVKGEGVQGRMMSMSRPLRHALRSLSVIARKNLYVPSGEVFPLVARGLLRNIALCSSGLPSSFSSAESPRNTCTFLSVKSPLGFRGAFFYRLSREEFSAARSESIVFLSGACGPSGAEGRACEAYLSGLSEPLRRAAYVIFKKKDPIILSILHS